MRNTKQREIVLDAVLTSKDHPSADQVYERIHVDHPHISRATVYRNLNLLAETGKIRHLAMPGSGSDRYDWRLEDHSHLVCKSCGRVMDIDSASDPKADHAIARKYGYHGVHHVLIFSGICPQCQKKLKQN